MNTSDPKKVGLFVYDWGMYHYIKDLAIKLAEAGYFVDLFFKDWDVRPQYADISEFDSYPTIRFFNFTTKISTRGVFIRRKDRLLNKIAMLFSIPRNFPPQKIIEGVLLKRSMEIIGTNQYYCFIGIEKKGLIWAGIISQIKNCPLIYYSLELYLEDNPVLDRVYHLLATEREFHKKSLATIIQDKLRAHALLSCNGVINTRILYLPVSSRGKVNSKRSFYLHDKLNIDRNKKIILYFGGLDKTRSIAEIVRSANNLDEDSVLVLHGFGPKHYIRHLKSIADPQKVRFSFDFVPEEQILELISSAHIGIAIYKTSNLNDRLVAFSSSKIAYYMQCGVPMITFDTESFRELANSHHCLELISRFDEIPQKTRLILANYDHYRQAAFDAYDNFYDFDKNFAKLVLDLESVLDSYYLHQTRKP